MLRLGVNVSDVFPKVLKLSCKVNECKPLVRGALIGDGASGHGRSGYRHGRQRRGERRGRPCWGPLAVERGRGLHSSNSQLNVCTFRGIRWVPSADRWVITRHKLKTKRFTDQTG